MQIKELNRKIENKIPTQTNHFISLNIYFKKYYPHYIQSIPLKYFRNMAQKKPEGNPSDLYFSPKII